MVREETKNRFQRINSKESIAPVYVAWARIWKRWRSLGIDSARLQRLTESLPWNRNLGSLKRLPNSVSGGPERQPCSYSVPSPHRLFPNSWEEKYTKTMKAFRRYWLGNDYDIHITLARLTHCSAQNLFLTFLCTVCTPSGNPCIFTYFQVRYKQNSQLTE